MATARATAGGGRKAEALAFIRARLIGAHPSPTIGDVACALKVSKTRAKALIHQLVEDGAITRTPGAQRAIAIPNLARERALAELRAEGWKIDEAIHRATFPQEHVAVVGYLRHDEPDGD